MNLNEYQQAAVRAGEWYLRNQVQDPLDANRGRYLYCREIPTKTFERSTGWQTGFGVFVMISLHRLTGEQRYLDSAALAMEYIKSLQILDARNPSRFGALREETPQTNWMHPRDAVSAAWALLGYGQYVKDADCLERARLYADWMLQYAFVGDWPLATIWLGAGGLETNDLRASCQSGGILFFHDMYDATQDFRYRDAAWRMSEYYARHFLSEQGELETLIDPVGNRKASFDDWPKSWREMHQVNDDFGGIAMVRSIEVFQQPLHRERLRAFAQWLVAWQKPSGGFMEPEMEVGSATVPIFLHAYRRIATPAERTQYDEVCRKALAHLLSQQQTSDDPQVDGAFLCLDNKCRFGQGRWVNIRCTSYAVIALLMQSGQAAFPIGESSSETV